MSKTIDSRVVEMRFDNKQFESNCATTMSTLDKLKQKLRLDGASKGLENVNTAAKKVDMNGLGSSVDTVRAKFSALEVMGVTALANITNSAVNAGKRIISALTIDPVKTGLSEYETKMNAIQVIQANTRTKNSMDDITKALEDLNVYADKTIYNFAQMTSNMGKFTAQGHDVFQAANAVKGLANLAAASGASAEDMARATYQMSQAMGGYIKLMDWNSLRNANMATQDLKNTLIDLAKVNGIAIDDMIKKHGTFEQTLSEGWLSGDMFTEAMNIYSGVYSDAELKAKGFTDEQIKNFNELAAMAESAATEVKTFTQLWDVLKETAQSGWTQTWEILIGDFATAKKMLTDVQNYFSNMINSWSDLRNNLFGGALNLKNPWEGITGKLNKSGLGKIVEVSETIEDATEKLKKFQNVVNKVWHGDFGNVDTGRFEGLEKAGFDPRVIQELVNKGLDYKLTVEDVEKAHEKFGLTMDKNVTNTEKFTEVMTDLSDEALRNAGLTEGEIRIYKALAKEAEKTGKSISEVAKEMSENDGRSMVIESIKNAWSGFLTILKSVKKAWEEVFPPMTIVQLYNGIKAVNKFSEHLKVSEETADKLRRTFKGVFAILDVITTILGGGFKIALKIVKELMKYFHVDILDVTAAIGDAAVKFRDFIDKLLDFQAIFDAIIGPIRKGIEAFRTWVETIKGADNIPKAIAEGIVSQFTWAYKGVVKALGQMINFIKSGFKELPDFMKSGLINGVWEMVTAVGQVFVELGKIILEKIKGVLGIHSPSTEFYEIGENIILGLVNGIKAGAHMAWDAIQAVGEKCIELIRDIDFSTVFAGLLTGGTLLVAFKISDAIKALAAPLMGLGDMLEEIGDAVKAVGTGVKNYLNGKALLSLAAAIAILALSIIKLSTIQPGRLWATIGAIAALAVIVVALTFAVNKINSIDGLKISPKAIISILAIAGAMLILSWAVAKLAKVDEKNMKTTLIVFGSLLIGVLILSKACSSSGSIKMAATLLAMATSLLILTRVISIIGKFKEATLLKGLTVIGLFEIFVIVLARIASKSTNGTAIIKLGGTLIAMAFALLILTRVFSIMGKLSAEAIFKGITVLTVFGVFIAALTKIGGMATKGRKSGQLILKLGGIMFGLAFALLAFAAIVSVLNRFNIKDILKGAMVVGLMGVLFAGLIFVSQKSGKHAGRVGLMLMAMSAAMLMLVGVIYIVSLLKPEALAKGLTVVLSIGAMMALVVAAAKNIKKAMGTITALTLAIVLLVGAIAILSFIDIYALTPAVGAVSIVLLSFATLLAGLGKLSSAKNVWKKLIPITLLLVVLGGIIWAMGKIDTKNAIENAAGLSMILIAIATSCKIMNKVSKINKTAIQGIFALVGVAAGAALVLAMMGALNVKDAIVNAISLGIFLNTMATALKIMNKVTTNKAAIKGMIAMAAVSAIAGLVLAMMSALKTGNAIVNAIALGIFMNTMATALLITDRVSTNKTAIKGMLMMSVCAAIAGVTLAIMSALKTENAIANAIALGIFMNTMATALLITSLVKKVSDKAITALGTMTVISALAGLVLAMMSALAIENAISNAIALGIFMNSMATALLITQFAATVSTMGLVGLTAMVAISALAAVVLAMMSSLRCDNAIANATALGILVNSLSVAMVICSIAGMVAGAALAGLGVLAAFIGGLAIVITTLGALVTWFPTLEEFLDKGIPILEKIGHGLGSFAGNIIGGFLEGVTDSLPKIAENLSSFAVNLDPFLTAIKHIDSDSTMGIRYLAEAMLILAGAELVDAVTFWSNDTSLQKFGKELAKFGPYVKEYADSVSGIDTEAVRASAEATKMLSEVAKNLPNSGGLWGLIAGENDLSDFGEMINTYGICLVEYASCVSLLNDKKLKAIDNSVKASEKLSDVAESLPNTGGLWSLIAGDNGIDEFGASIVSYGECLVNYANSVTQLDDTRLQAIDNSAKASEKLRDIAASLPDTGGLWGLLAGDNSIDTFGSNLSSYGGMLVEYANKVSELDETKLTAIGNSVTATRSLVDVARLIPESGGIFSALGKNSNLDYFGTLLSSYGRSLVKFADTVSDFNPDDIKGALSATKDIIAVAPSGDYSGIKSLSDNIKPLGKTLTTYGEIDSSGMRNVTAELKSIISLASETLGKDFSGLNSLTDSLGVLGEDGVGKFVKAFNNASHKMVNAGKSLVEDVIDGIEKKYNRLKTAGNKVVDKVADGIEGNDAAYKEMKDVAEDAEDAVRDKYDSFSSAGSYLVSGLIAGINAKKEDAVAAATSLASAVYNASRVELDVNSPSRKYIALGNSAGEGMVMGLNEFEPIVYTAGSELANSVVNGSTNAMSSLSDALSVDIESVEPTITPVLDLTNVEEGLRGIGDYGINIGGNITRVLDGINADVSRYTDNSNDDIVDKLDELIDVTASADRSTYNINGITYAGDSELDEAVRIIVRAAKVERRR